MRISRCSLATDFINHLKYCEQLVISFTKLYHGERDGFSLQKGDIVMFIMVATAIVVLLHGYWAKFYLFGIPFSKTIKTDNLSKIWSLRHNMIQPLSSLCENLSVTAFLMFENSPPFKIILSKAVKTKRLSS